MAAPNTEPIYSKVGDIQWIGVIVTANNTKDLTGAGVSYLAFTADSTNGGYVRELRLKADPANNTAATVLRIWINNGSTITVAANSILLGEMGIPATTASATAALPEFVYSLGFAVPASYRLYVTIGTAPGGSGQFSVTVVGGRY
jgi:hypothetical protein